MEITPQKSLIIIDPYLLISVRGRIADGSLRSCQCAKFFICDHLSESDFISSEYSQIQAAIECEDIEQLPVNAIEMGDLFTMRNHLVPYQIASIAAARFYEFSFASDCCIFQGQARSVLGDKKVLSGSEIIRMIKPSHQ